MEELPRGLFWVCLAMEQYCSSVVVTQPRWSWGTGVWIGWRDIGSLMQHRGNNSVAAPLVCEALTCQKIFFYT